MKNLNFLGEIKMIVKFIIHKKLYRCYYCQKEIKDWQKVYYFLKMKATPEEFSFCICAECAQFLKELHQVTVPLN